VEQVRQWIADGRANSQTKAQVEGTPDWKPLADFPEFAAALAAKAALPPPPPRDGHGSSAEAEALAREILAADYNIDVFSCLERAWEKVKSDFWPIVGVSAVVFLLMSASSAAYVGLVIAGPLLGGLISYYLKLIRGQKAEMTDAFSGFSTAFLQLFLGALVSGLLVVLGVGLCILPGIFLGVAWKFTLPLIIDKRLDFWPAMELSRKVITRHWWNFFGLMVLSSLINLAGVLVCCVGIFVTFPVTVLALMYAYEDIFGPARFARPAAAQTLKPI
jgi:hypothetical protein